MESKGEASCLGMVWMSREHGLAPELWLARGHWLDEGELAAADCLDWVPGHGRTDRKLQILS